MGAIEWYGAPISDYSDEELLSRLGAAVGDDGYKPRAKTLAVWAAALRAFDEAGPPMTVRQTYYALVSRGVVGKTEPAYDSVGYHLLQMRRRGIIPYNFLADNTRWMRRPTTYGSLTDCLEITKQAYRRSLWSEQLTYVEIWCEKDALAGVLNDVTNPWDVPLMVTRGFPSETFMYEAAEQIKNQNKPSYVYYFGDYDPSGMAIVGNVRDRLREFGATFNFSHVAVTEQQVRAWNLPLRPTKKSDGRSKGWVGGSVELDAVPVKTLRQLVEMCITQHIDWQTLESVRRAEELERASLAMVVNNFRLAQNSCGGVS